MVQREFLDYVDANGTNAIEAWLESFGADRVAMEMKLRVRLGYISAAPVIRDNWMEKLKGADDGIYEIKLFYSGVEYRILSCYGPGKGQVTMLFPATEHNDKLRPPSARKTAGERKAQIEQPGRTMHHDY